MENKSRLLVLAPSSGKELLYNFKKSCLPCFRKLVSKLQNRMSTGNRAALQHHALSKSFCSKSSEAQ